MVGRGEGTTENDIWVTGKWVDSRYDGWPMAVAPRTWLSRHTTNIDMKVRFDFL